MKQSIPVRRSAREHEEMTAWEQAREKRRLYHRERELEKHNKRDERLARIVSVSSFIVFALAIVVLAVYAI